LPTYHAATVSDNSVDRFKNAYERMNDSPTQPSILIRNPSTMIQGLSPLNSFFDTGTVLMSPGLSPTVIPPPTFLPRPGTTPSGSGEMMSVPMTPIDGLSPIVPVRDTPLDVL